MGKVSTRNVELSMMGRPNYVDNYDYTHGRGVLVFLGTHRVTGLTISQPFRHAMIVMIASPNSILFNYSAFDPHRDTTWPNFPRYVNSGVYVYGGRFRVATLGGTAEGAGIINNVLLEGGINMPNDVDINNKTQMILLNYHIINNTSFRFIELAVIEMFSMTYNFNSLGYRRPVYYLLAAGTNRFNSNSWAHGLLRALGLWHVPTPDWVTPGWTNPVPAGFFNAIHVLNTHYDIHDFIPDIFESYYYSCNHELPDNYDICEDLINVQ